MLMRISNWFPRTWRFGRVFLTIFRLLSMTDYNFFRIYQWTTILKVTKNNLLVLRILNPHDYSATCSAGRSIFLIEVRSSLTEMYRRWICLYCHKVVRLCNSLKINASFKVKYQCKCFQYCYNITGLNRQIASTFLLFSMTSNELRFNLKRHANGW